VAFPQNPDSAPNLWSPKASFYIGGEQSQGRGGVGILRIQGVSLESRSR
jgi:hypothetical protein